MSVISCSSSWNPDCLLSRMMSCFADDEPRHVDGFDHFKTIDCTGPSSASIYSFRPSNHPEPADDGYRRYYRCVILSYYHIIILSPDHNTKWLKSFLVPSQGFRHILSHLPLLQGSLPKNKGSSGNNFLRRISHCGSEIHSSSKTPLFQKKSWPPKKFSKKISRHFFSASKNEKLQIVRNAFSQSFAPIRALIEG